MDSICAEYFTHGSCSLEECPNAHHLSDLSTPECWVLFHAELEMLDFLPYKFQSHHLFRSVSLPGKGRLVRFASEGDALAVVSDFVDYYSPTHLPCVLGQNSEGIPSSTSSDMVALDALCRRELKFINKRISQVTGRGSGANFSSHNGSFALSNCSSFCSSPVPRGVLGSPDSPRRAHLDIAGLDDFSSECLSSDSSPGTPIHAFSRLPLCLPGSPSSAERQYRSRPAQKTDRSSGIIGVLQAQAARGPGFVGWAALEELWGITPGCLDDAVLTYLTRKTPAEQEQILLSFAAIDLGTIQNLSAYLNCLIKEHETTSQVCLHFLAGLCNDHNNCRYIHPVNTAGWALLESKWNISYKDFDYAVLNYLSKKPVHQQDEIMTLFADMNLKTVKNRSAYLSSMIERYERVGLRKRTRARGKAAKGKGMPLLA